MPSKARLAALTKPHPRMVKVFVVGAQFGFETVWLCHQRFGDRIFPQTVWHTEGFLR